MAAEVNNNATGTRKETGSTRKQLPTEPEKQVEKSPETYSGRVQNGELYCDCEGEWKAQCLTVVQNKASKGRKYWRCRRYEHERCTFFIWDSDAPAAKEWLAIHGPPPTTVIEPQTPRTNRKEPVDPAQNPWTLAAKSSKRKVQSFLREESRSEGEPVENAMTPETESDNGDLGEESPSRKATKRKRSDTPGKVREEERAKESANGLPTPENGIEDVGGKIVTCDGLPTPVTDKRPTTDTVATTNTVGHTTVATHGSPSMRDIARASIRLGEVIDLTNDQQSTLTTAVLDELKSAKVELKESTKVYIGHLIDEEMELHDTRMRRAQITISRMKKKLDEMESALLAVTGMTDDEALELSD